MWIHSPSQILVCRLYYILSTVLIEKNVKQIFCSYYYLRITVVKFARMVSSLPPEIY